VPAVERSVGESAIHSRRVPASFDEYAYVFVVPGFLLRAEDKQVTFV